MTTTAASTPAGLWRGLRVGLAGFILVPLVALGLVFSHQPPANALAEDPPIVKLIEAVKGTVTKHGGALKVAGWSSRAGWVGLAGAAAFGAGYYGSTAVLEWAFDDPEDAGTQPSLQTGTAVYPNNCSPTYQGTASCPNSASLMPEGSKQFAFCQGGGSSTVSFDPAASGTWSNVNTGCFSTGHSVAGTTSASVSLNMPAWRCKVQSCSAAVKLMPLNPEGDVIGTGNSFGAFTNPWGAAGSHAANTPGNSCSGWSASGWGSQSACIASYERVRWEAWFDPTQIEFTPAPRESIVVERTCRNMTTGTESTSGTTSGDFYGQPSPMNVSALACPDGSTGKSVEIKRCGPSGTSCLAEPLYRYDADPRVHTPQESDPHRKCLPGGSAAPCTVRLYKMTANGWKLCSADTDCHTYDPERTWAQNTWKCEWGPYVVAVGDCAPLADWTATTANNTDTETDPAPDPNATPTPAPTPTTGTETFPREGTNPGTKPHPTDPGTDPEPNAENCWGGMWSWNPIDWVYVPVKCALSWAFKPPAGYWDTKFGTLQASWGATTPAQWVTAIGGLVPGSVTGCEGIPLDVDFPGGVEVHERIGAACSGFMADAAAVVRLAVSAVVVVFGGLTCIRALGSGLGWSPGVGRSAET